MPVVDPSQQNGNRRPSRGTGQQNHSSPKITSSNTPQHPQRNFSMNNNIHSGHNRALLHSKKTNQVADALDQVATYKGYPVNRTLPHIKKALILLHKSHIDILDTLTPTQKLVLATYHRLIISMYKYMKSQA